MIIEEDLERTHKIIVVGNGRIGKTTMITRFAKGHFLEDYKKTLGVAFLEKNEFVPSVGREINFHLWDTAGQEEFDALTREYYKGASGCLLAFSPTDKDSFNAVKSWQGKVIAECGKIPMIIIQTKSDLSSSAIVTPDQVAALAEEMRLNLYRTSSKENKNVKEAFHKLAEMIEKSIKEGGFASKPGPVMNIGEITRKNRVAKDREIPIKSQEQNVQPSQYDYPQTTSTLNTNTSSQYQMQENNEKKEKGDCKIF